MAVKITIAHNQLAVVDPPLPELESVLRYRHPIFEARGKSGWRESANDVSLTAHDFLGRLVFSAGLLQRVKDFLAANGHQVQIDDRRTQFEPLKADAEVLYQATLRQLAALQAMRDRTLGQIEVATRRKRSTGAC